MKRVLVTGASGMLGATLVAQWNDVFDVFATGRSDFPGNPAKNYRRHDLRSGSVNELARWAKPDTIVHCAAMTDVDACEIDENQTMAVNGQSVSELLKAAPDARVIFVSTDAVMPQAAHLPSEDVCTDPNNAYGRSKQVGEQLVLDAPGEHTVVRTTIVGRNINPAHVSFVEWIVTSVSSGRTIQLFDDVCFTPITCWRLADELRWLIDNEAPRLLHIAGSEPVSKYDFGTRLCARLGLSLDGVRPGRLADHRFRAARSADQTLSCELFETVSGHRLPGLKQTLDQLAAAFRDMVPPRGTDYE